MASTKTVLVQFLYLFLALFLLHKDRRFLYHHVHLLQKYLSCTCNVHINNTYSVDKSLRFGNACNTESVLV